MAIASWKAGGNSPVRACGCSHSTPPRQICQSLLQKIHRHVTQSNPTSQPRHRHLQARQCHLQRHLQARQCHLRVNYLRVPYVLTQVNAEALPIFQNHLLPQRISVAKNLQSQTNAEARPAYRHPIQHQPKPSCLHNVLRQDHRGSIPARVFMQLTVRAKLAQSPTCSVQPRQPVQRSPMH